MKLKTLTIPLVMLATLGLTSCASGRYTVITPPVCSARIPPNILDSVKPVDPPTGNTIGDWVAGFDGQTAQLETEVDRKQSVIWIVKNCERETQAAADSVNRRWYEFWK